MFNYSLRRKNPRLPGSHIFQQTLTISELILDVISNNVLTKFHEDWTINAISRVLKRKIPCPGLAAMFFHPTGTFTELAQDMIGKNHLTTFHEDWTINVASCVLTRHMLMTHDGRRTKGDHKSSL
ncbi:hypothetical protein DPMN_022285 [Dreissena polymorpha]|uniref:Uncharacterized protein n=1 Tax=Dreissena polymorpha TaxID=45954 RepID=A0A9D4NQ43_DREPO|nr:hypothetical protein DPMN_022283 [Dreissena polymorpha]KAH3898086.1 hypothetical protein DPMN_022285 [Dreissena polymorpha]